MTRTTRTKLTEGVSDLESLNHHHHVHRDLLLSPRCMVEKKAMMDAERRLNVEKAYGSMKECKVAMHAAKDAMARRDTRIGALHINSLIARGALIHYCSHEFVHVGGGFPQAAC